MFITSLITAALAVAQPAPAPASAPAVEAAATLARPGEARRQVFDGRAWSCAEDGVCAGSGVGASQPVMRECRRFVARFGPVASFVRDGVELTAAELEQCNAAARR